VFGRLLHDGTADQIARAISRLPRVVATIVPFDVAGLIARREEAEEAQRHNGAAVAPPGARVPVQATVSASVAPAIETPTPNGTRRSLSPDATEPATPPETAPTPISGLQWRHRAAVEGRVRTVRVAAMSGAPCLEVELWDDTAGVTLVFYGRRGIPGITPGAALAVEGMVGERHGRAAMANPRYRLLGTAAG
jgi:hypothetical protein